MTVLWAIPFLLLGLVLIAWGVSYRLQGKRFRARFGDSTSPTIVIICGALAVFLAASIAWTGV